MPRERPGYASLNIQVPTVIADLFAADVQARGLTMSGVITKLLAREYKVPLSELPPRRRLGRPPSKRKEN